MSLGIGIACVTSVGPRFTLASEKDCLAQGLCRALITTRGSLPWAPNVGTDMREFLNGASTPQGRSDAARAAKDECEKDERVQTATVTPAYDASSSSLTLTIAIDSADGPFVLVVLVDNLTVSLLAVQ